MNGLLPIERTYESDLVVAFFHPSPEYPFHMLIMPKKPFHNLTELAEAGEPQVIIEIIEAARQMVARFGLERCGYRLIVNGGPYQDIPQVHFHLVSEKRESRIESREK
jgi:histidine triad (HIT) family protein